MSGSFCEDQRVKEWLDLVDIETPKNRDPALALNLALVLSDPARSRNRKRGPTMMDDEDATPVAKRSRGMFIPTPTESIRRNAASEDAQSTTTSTSASQSRSSSPTKRKHHLSLASPSILFLERQDLLPRQEEFRKNIPCFSELFDMVKSAQTQLPAGLETFLNSRTDELEPPPLRKYSTSPELDKFADLAPDIEALMDDIRLCKKKDVTEEEWCHRLVYPMLQLAAKRLSTSNRVEVATVKGIDVSPSTLLPTQQGYQTQKKRVDYSLCFQLQDSRKVRNILESLSTNSLNQCDHPRLYDHVLFSHVEVKRKSTSREGEIQLGIWTAAGFKKTQKLIERKQNMTIRMPAAQPLWLWEDDELRLFVALLSEPEELPIYQLAQWHLHQDDHLVRAIISLAKVMEWALSSYLCWFTDVISYDGTDGIG